MGVLWGMLYALVGEPVLAASVAGLVEGHGLRPGAAAGVAGGRHAAARPWVLGVGVTGPVAASGELIRHVAYGALLGLLYPIFRARRPVRVVAHTPADIAPEPAIGAEH